MSDNTKTGSTKDYYKLEFHSLADVFPPMAKKEFETFKADIKANGIRVPITLHGGQILDGRNRYSAAKEAGRLFRNEDFAELPNGVDPIKFVISANVARRHLSERQRAMAAAKLANLPVGTNQHNGTGVSIDTASDLMSASKATTNRCKKVLTDGVPELVKLVEQDKIAASVAEEVAKLPKEKQAELVAKPATSIPSELKKLTQQTETSTEKSDKVDGLVDQLINALKEYKLKSTEGAKNAVAELMKRLKDADLKAK
jgi:hypothetical protein